MEQKFCTFCRKSFTTTQGYQPWAPPPVKVALDGGTVRDTAQGHPSNPPSCSCATPKPPLYYLPLCVQGTPFTHTPSWIFQGHSFTKDNNWNCNLILYENMHFR